MKAAAKLQAKGIQGVDLSKINQDQLITCPFCTPNRKKKRMKDLSVKVTPECIVYKCHHCGQHGSFFDDKDDKNKNYVKPKWQNVTALSSPTVKWFKGRSIDQ